MARPSRHGKISANVWPLIINSAKSGLWVEKLAVAIALGLQGEKPRILAVTFHELFFL